MKNFMLWGGEKTNPIQSQSYLVPRCSGGWKPYLKKQSQYYRSVFSVQSSAARSGNPIWKNKANLQGLKIMQVYILQWIMGIVGFSSAEKQSQFKANQSKKTGFPPAREWQSLSHVKGAAGRMKGRRSRQSGALTRWAVSSIVQNWSKSGRNRTY